MSNDEPIRILIADEHALFRESVRGVLESEPDLRVVAEARDGLRAVAEAVRDRPDVAVLDADLPNGDGIRATRQIRDRVPTCRVVVLGDEELNPLVEALEAGANAYLTRGCAMSELIATTRQVARGRTLIPPQMLGDLITRLLRRRHQQDEAFRRFSLLTRREREVITLLAGGANNDAIARQLVISPETARTHIQRALGKLGVHSRLAAAAFIIQNRMLDELTPAGR